MSRAIGAGDCPVEVKSDPMLLGDEDRRLSVAKFYPCTRIVLCVQAGCYFKRSHLCFQYRPVRVFMEGLALGTFRWLHSKFNITSIPQHPPNLRVIGLLRKPGFFFQE